MKLHRQAAAVAQGRALIAEFGLPLDVDPHAALLQELHRSAGVVAWLQQRVQELEEGELTGPVGVEGVSRESGQESHPRYEPHVYYRMLTEERTHFVKIAKTCVDAGIEERKIKLVEEQGQLMAGAIKLILEDLGIDPTTNKIRKIVRDRLTSIEGSAVELTATNGGSNGR